jgi:putative tricarboxylic transport membrane protein
MPGQKFGPAWFPGLVGGALGICGVLLVFAGLRSGAAWLRFPDWLQRERSRAAVLAVLGGVVFYILAADKLGFYLTGIVIIALWVRVLGASWRMTILMAVIAPLIIHLAFYKGLRVPLPWGLLEQWAF